MIFPKNIFLAFVAFAISYMLTPLTIPLSHVTGAMDIPDGNRKINKFPIPRMGGLGFFLAAFLVIFPIAAINPFAAALLSAGAVLVAGGVLDDTFGTSPMLKLLIQSLCAVIVISFIGIPDEFSFLGVIKIPLVGILGFTFTLFRILFTINAVNFCDGLDGLASGLSVVALLSLFVYGTANSNYSAALCALVIAAAVLGFLPYNKYHAKVFMGDCGSQFLGLAISVLSLATAPDGNFSLETSLFLSVPAIDTVLSVARRIIKRKSPFVADKGHLHHALLKIGISHPHASNLLVAFSGLIALISLLLIDF